MTVTPPADTEQVKACVECGEGFTSHPKARGQRFCSRACLYRERDRRRLTTRDCFWCGTPFTSHPHKGQRVCSTQCSVNLRKSEAGELVTALRWTECGSCGVVFLPPHGSPRILCSETCAADRLRDQQREWNKANRPYVRKVYEPQQCEWCAATFTPRTDPHLYCSSRCSHSAAKERRDQAKRNAFVERVIRAKVYERDDWCCQLCGKQVNRTASVPHPNAPTLDHILPISKGGTHEYANVQLAHFMCNSIKGSGGTDQLRLVG